MLHLQTLTQVKITVNETHFNFLYILVFYHVKKIISITNAALNNIRFHIFLFLNERNNYDIYKKIFECCCSSSLNKVYIAVLYREGTHVLACT